MKFQKDNSKVVFTQEMKNQIVIEEERQIKEVENKETHEIEVKEKLEILSDLYSKLENRLRSYGTIGDQLDMLWHDINEGRIQANTTSSNSWFSFVKTSKETFPLSVNWEQDIVDARDEAKKCIANTAWIAANTDINS